LLSGNISALLFLYLLGDLTANRSLRRAIAVDSGSSGGSIAGSCRGAISWGSRSSILIGSDNRGSW